MSAATTTQQIEVNTIRVPDSDGVIKEKKKQQQKNTGVMSFIIHLIYHLMLCRVLEVLKPFPRELRTIRLGPSQGTSTHSYTCVSIMHVLGV